MKTATAQAGRSDPPGFFIYRCTNPVVESGYCEQKNRKIITKKSDFTENADRLQIRKVKKEK